MSEQEYHPADPHFNPAHPEHEQWAGRAKPLDMPAEAGIGAMLDDPNGPIQEADVMGSEETVPEPYEEWPYADLKEECKTRGLKMNGSAEELAARLHDYDEEHPEEEESGEPPEVEA